MAKPFYSIEEVCEKLGKTQDQVRKLVREGSLREFRDAGKIFFKAEDVDQLAGSGKKPPEQFEPLLDAVDDKPEVPEVPEIPELATPSLPSGGTSIIGLEPIEEEKKEDTVITASGIGVFDDDELEIDADPMAATQITTGPIDDQVSLEGGGSSGSGLLDLTRESDDTSLGAELLDEIYPGEDESGAKPQTAEAAPEPAAPAAEPQAVALATAAPVEALEVVAPLRAQVIDQYEGLFAGFLVSALLLLGLAGSVVGGVLQGFLPDYATLLAHYFYPFLAAACGLVVVSAVVGMLLGRVFMRR
ncbi:MAG: helix-turn-helix domain-containing protein [Phycisphaerae bacterium]|mgnify:FL=1|nr:helix-turn-helix domain-containing protein [Phycisphaerae bacterium]